MEIIFKCAILRPPGHGALYSDLFTCRTASEFACLYISSICPTCCWKLEQYHGKAEYPMQSDRDSESTSDSGTSEFLPITPQVFPQPAAAPARGRGPVGMCTKAGRERFEGSLGKGRPITVHFGEQTALVHDPAMATGTHALRTLCCCQSTQVWVHYTAFLQLDFDSRSGWDRRCGS